MAVPTCYVETSAWGSLGPRQPADRRRIVRQLLGLLDGVHGVCMVSARVLGEIAKAPPAERAVIQRQMDLMQLAVCPPSESVAALAWAYVRAGVLSARRLADAEHIAAATCFECDYLVSWNHRHMTRPSKKLQYEAVNRVNGYLRTPLICNPLEACDDLRLR